MSKWIPVRIVPIYPPKPKAGEPAPEYPDQPLFYVVSHVIDPETNEVKELAPKIPPPKE